MSANQLRGLNSIAPALRQPFVFVAGDHNQMQFQSHVKVDI